MSGALLGVLWVAPLSAQEATGSIRGRVIDNATQLPLAGAAVTVGSRSALTQANGDYLVTLVPVGTVTLRARFLGYTPMTQSVTVAAGETAVAEFALTAQAVGLSEVVVIGYGEQTAGNITGAVTQVSSDQFNTGRIVSPQQLIQGKVPGVQVVDNNEPGGGLTVRIRGNTSANASNEPLYVIDGVPLGNGAGGGLSAGRDPLNFLNPNDIENITVLRDASAAAIYGSNAANGVVLITTKSGRGTPGTRVEYSSSASASSVTRTPNVLNATQFEAAVTQYAPARIDSLLGANTNWFDLIGRTAYGQEHNVSLTNTAGSMGYRLSLGYLNQDGIIRGSTTERITVGLNYQQRLFNDRLGLRTYIRGSRARDLFTPGDVLGNAASMAPTQPVLDSASSTGYWDWNTTQASPSNPVASLNLASDHGTTLRSVGNVVAEYQLPFLEGLAANLNLSYDITRADRITFFPNNLAAQVRQGQGSFFMANNTQGVSALEWYLNYAPSRTYGPGAVNLVGGYSYTQSHGDFPSLLLTNLSSNLLGDDGIPDALNVTNVRGIVDYKLISFFGRLNYNVGDRYLASLTLRRDGSSRFGPGNQWGTFPSVAFGWRLSEESFMPRLGSLSDLKLRVSWAKTGNQAFGDYLQYPTYTFSDGLSRVQFGNQFVTTIRPSAVDEFIHWETTNAYDVGLDYAFSGGRFSGAIDWYTKNTSDLLFNVPVAAGTTLANYVTTNIGSMKNTGIELSLMARVKEGRDGGPTWTSSFTASHNSNELLAINPNRSVSRVLTGGISGGVGNMVQVLQPGVPVNSFYVYEQMYDAAGKPIEGGYVDQATVLDTIACPAGPTCVGLFRPDGVINDQDRRPFHDPAPKWIFGHSSYVTYGHFDASFTLRAYLGNYVYNNVASSNGAYQNLSGSGMPSNLHASVLETGFVVPQYLSDYYVEKASFLRMDNITVGYSFDYRGQPFRVYGTVDNVLTLTGYSGVDPTSGLNGIDNNIYPRSRTITTGLSVRF
jgi:iron complex outermembrane receptor protein